MRVEKDNPCKPDCPDRCVVPNCHTTCPKYLKWKSEFEEEKKKIKEHNEKHRVNSTKMYTTKTINLFKKYHNRRKDGY